MTGMGRVVLYQIRLNSLERRICDAIKDYCGSGVSGQGEPLRPRIAGGWVRDKLLGLDSEDIDVVVNNISGEQFVSGLVEFLRGRDVGKVGSVHKINRNPEKSKHLETCTTHLFGVPVDFVNLRSERYTEDSRIPVVEFGTPLQDAMRRDATLNALFYNIIEEKVEDFTGSGLKDLSEGVLRTPILPQQTFKDDPLRILRLLRFASRFSFVLDPEALEAMKQEDIHRMLETKVSRERVGVEVHKILISKSPLCGIKLMLDAGLMRHVFSYMGGASSTALDNCYKRMISGGYKLVGNLTHVIAGYPLLGTWYEDCNFREHMLLSLILAPFNELYASKHSRKGSSALGRIIKDSLRYPKLSVELVELIVGSLNEYHECVINHASWPRSRVGEVIRKLKGHWELCHCVTLTHIFLEGDNLEGETLVDLTDKYQRFENFVKDNGLTDVHNLKPLIDGKEIAKLYNIRGGPWMSTLMHDILMWQMDHPESSKDQLISWMLPLKDKYLSP
ncbi:tRNA adenylyltransferase Ecym_5566 [Eremothecium cymbalariae DBVPG|uniref:CCA tRNA nucleotidyltransferase, mitochondrial n=1 Tax=Eremothecium cymbalariae (strain CBS 270.75 / DBVPG 7215 / KCTC 17166 / NRRL Y-17582) TaxID=931890 RepID=I6NE12_ERECY|nr:hypothetical protein Ecym_5566 [Eremothecium cymbalariae DBVPG\